MKRQENQIGELINNLIVQFLRLLKFLCIGEAVETYCIRFSDEKE